MSDRLSASDAAFLYSEDANAPMQVGGVVILQPGRDPFNYSSVVELVASRLQLVPRYRQKVRMVPGRLARPVWVDDEAFDLSYHVRRSALPRPGTQAQLGELVGRLISRPLDRARPLWELYIVEGLTDGRIALINKTHHCLVSRIGSVDVAAAILDVSATPRPLAVQAWLPTPAPSEVDLVVDAIADIAARPTEVVDAVRLTALDLRATVSEVGHAVNSAVQMARRTVRPALQSALNAPVPGQRSFVGLQLPLAQLKTVRQTHGGSVNDIILAVISGALRSFLLSRGEPLIPGTQVRAMVPLSVSEDDGSASVVSYLVDLPVSEPNPVIRLHQVSFAMGAHTDSGTGLAADALLQLGRFAPPTLHALGARVGSEISRRIYSVLITNVPGPQRTLFAAGLAVAAMFPVTSLAKGHALAIAVTSYNGQVFFGLTADRNAMPDLDDFATQLVESLGELVDTARPPAAESAGTTPTAGAVKSADAEPPGQAESAREER